MRSHGEGNAKGQVTLHIGFHLDGFIAKKHNSVSWMDSTSVYEAGVSVPEGEAAAFVQTIDCYVMGSPLPSSCKTGWPTQDQFCPEWVSQSSFSFPALG